jgi:hypothetical protein
LDTRRGSAIARPDQSRKIVGVYFREPQATFEIHSNPPKAAKGQGEMNELEPAKTQWLWFGAALAAMTIIAFVASGLPR